MDRTERFGMVLSATEKQVLQLLAEGEGGLSQAALLRHLLRQAARDRGLLPGDLNAGQPCQEVRDDCQIAWSGGLARRTWAG